MRVIQVFGVVMFVAAVQAAPRVARACSCPAPLAAPESLKSASAVFEGTVLGQAEPLRDPTDRHRPSTTHLQRLEVKRRWKGDVGAKVTVSSGNDQASCGDYLEPGETYLIFANESGGSLWHGVCSGTKRSANAAADFAALGASLEPVAGPGAFPEPPVRTSADDLHMYGCSAGGGTPTGLATLLLTTALAAAAARSRRALVRARRAMRKWSR